MGLGNAEGGGGSGAIRAGRAFVELALDDNKVYRSLETLKGKLQGIGNFFLKTGGGLFGAGSAILAPIVGIFTESVYKLDELNKASERLGTSTESLSKLGFAAKFAGLHIEDVETSAKHLEKNISEAAQGSAEAANKFAQIGLNAQDLIKLPLDQQFLKIAEAMDNIANPADRVNVALGLFGKSGSQLLPLLKTGETGLGARFAQAEKLGFVTSGSKAEDATKFVDAFTLVIASAKKTVSSFAVALFPILPTVERLAEKFAESAAEARKFIKENIGIVTAAAAVGVGLIAAGSAVIGFGVAFKITAIAVGGIIALMKLLAAGTLAVLSPVGILVGLVGGLGYLWATQTESGQKFVGDLKTGFEEAAETAKTSFAGISDAISAGDFTLAIKIALTGLRLEWAKVVAYWTDKWNQFKGIFVDGWSAAVTSTAILLNDMAAGAEKVFESMATGIGNAFRYIAEKALDAAIAVAEALDKLDPTDSLKGAIEGAKQLREQVNEGAREAARAARDQKLAEIEKRKQAIDLALLQAHSREQKAREQSRAGDLKAAQDDIARLQAELQRLTQQASDQAKGPTRNDNPLFGLIFGNVMAALQAIPGPASIGSHIKGGFNASSAGQQFGIADTWEKQVARLLTKTEQNTAEMAKTMIGLVTALRFQ